MPSSFGKPRKVLILATNPPDTEALNLGEEIRGIQSALSQPAGAFEVHYALAARIEDLENLLMEHEPYYVHLCGHGLGDYGILFHEESSTSRTISTERLETLFAELRKSIHCVFLNCCESLPQAKAIARYIPYAIGTTQKIGDPLAIEFSSLFYRAISRGRTVRKAFDIAKSVTAGTPEAQTPILIPRRRSNIKTPPGAPPPETAVLRGWIQEDHCRLIVLRSPASLETLSSKKSFRQRPSLAVRLTRELALEEEFEHIGGTSLAERPSLKNAILTLLSPSSTHVDIKGEPSDPLARLLGMLRSRRCFLCIEDMDAILTQRNGETRYLERFEAYGQLFHQIATSNHKSCLILSGRGIPPGIKDDPQGAVRVLDRSLPTSSVSAQYQAAGPQAAKRETAPRRLRSGHAPSREQAKAPEADSLPQVLDHLVRALRQSRDAVIVLGPESASEGWKGNEPYPTLEDLARRILKDDAAEGRAALLARFRELLQRWDEDSSDYLSEYLAGEPGPAHYYLAALALTIFPHRRLLLFVGTSFDELLAEAFNTLQRGESRVKVHVLRLDPRMTSEDFRQLYQASTMYVNRGEPVLLKLYGDLGAESPLLVRKAKHGPLREKLDEWLKSPLIFIGCDFEDRLLQELLLHSPGRGPAFIVGNTECPLRIREGRGVYHIPASFGTFVTGLIGALQANEEERALLARMGEFLCRVPPQALYPDGESIARRAEIISRGALSRNQARLPRSENDERASRFVPITRLDTGPDLLSFLNDPRPLLAVVGDSGTGKSTLFYQIYQAEGEFVPIFYDAHEIDPKDSLSRRLAHDLFCDEQRLEGSLEKIDTILRHSARKLLILIDGINETQKIITSVLKSEIETLARRLQGRVKIAYSCRKIYWDNYIAGEQQVPTDLYFGSKEFLLGRFSSTEVEEAFRAYQELYRFRGSFAALSTEFQDRITDPLMLRMLAEGYEGKQLPSFAPAVLIFDTYLKRFHRSFKGTVLPGFLELLVESKIQEAESGRPTDQFNANEVRTHPRLNALIQQHLKGPKRPIEPLVLLEDEGVLTALNEEASIYRFAYDRFFEYLLGRTLPIRRTAFSRREFPSYLREQIQRLSKQQFWFLQALKSEIIRLNIEDPDGPWSLYAPSTVRLLLEDPDAQVSMFTRDILRELLFEGERDLFPVLRDACADVSVSNLLILDIAPDSPRVLPLLVLGLTAGDKEVARRSCHLLGNFISTPEHQEAFENALLRKLTEEPLDPLSASGFFYYSAVLFGEADRRNLDPLPVVASFWRLAWSRIKDHPEAADILTSSLIKVVRDEAGQFFGNPNPTAMDYLWTWMRPEIKELALRMLPFLVDPKLPLTEELQEILLFFGSCIKNWEDRKNPRLESGSTYKMEYLIAKWILLQRSRESFEEVKETLGKFMATGFSRTIEVALSNLEACCVIFFRGKEYQHLLKDAFATLEEWTELFRQTGEGFYWPLSKQDPLSLNESPLEMAARVAILDEISPGEGPLPFLERWITDTDKRNVLFALVCAKGLWREKPAKILRTLELVARSEDETVVSWLNRILKEIYLVYPRLVEDFFWRNSFPAQRIQEIKHRSDIRDPSRVSHSGMPLYKALFLTTQARRERFAEWYRSLLCSASLEDFCAEWLRSFLTELTAEGR